MITHPLAEDYLMNKDFPEKKCSFGELLFRYMSKNQTRIEKLAQKISVDATTIDHWLNEDQKMEFEHLAKIANFFNLTKEERKEWFLSAGYQHQNIPNQKLPSFAELLTKYLKEKPINSSTLAKKIGTARITISRWRDGKVKKPRCENVVEIADILELKDDERDELLLSAGCRPVHKSLIEIVSAEWVEIAETYECTPIPGIPISHPSQFFGQTQALKRIRRAWQQPSTLQHVAVIGERRSGKTSLLKYLQQIAKTPITELRPEQPQGWNRWLPKNFQFAFVDFQRITMSKPESLLRNILKQLKLDAPEPCDLISFSELLEDHLDKPTIILMDEVGAGLKSPDLDSIFWSNMRALGSIGQLGLVITAHEPIHTLAKDNGKESPFFNIFGHTMRLGPLTEPEALKLINSFSHPLTTEDVDWLLQNSGGWTALLQILCDERIHALEENETNDNWKTRGLERIEPFLYLLKK
jgi:transcriptional regulator with XRE-family HTH domain